MGVITSLQQRNGTVVLWAYPQHNAKYGDHHRHRIDKYLDTLLAMKSEATAIFSPQDGRWKTTVSFDGRMFCVPKFRH